MLPDKPEEPPEGLIHEIPETSLDDARTAVLAFEERRVRQRQAPPVARPRAPIAWVAAASVAWLLVAVTLITRPAWSAGATPRPYVAPAGDASLRYGVWLAAHRITEFERENGRLPSFLAEAGIADSALRYAVTGERAWGVTAREGVQWVMLLNTMSADSFLGDARQRLRGGGGR
jgi:hypothetical protein